VVDLVLERFGKIDLLVNAAGCYAYHHMVEDDRFLNSIAPQFNVNVMVPAKLASIVARGFWLNRKEGNLKENRNIVNVSSTSGLYIFPNAGQSVYSASKAALNYLTLHMADEFNAFGVRVNAAAPTTFPDIITAEQAAETILHLDEGAMTGEILVVDENGEHLV
jgi:NAD(P)-dependent dehydrogenase (short-subunit alcohol dehydrogenase family)